MDRQRHPSSGALRFLSPTVLLYRLPASKNKNVATSLDIPVVFESSKYDFNVFLKLKYLNVSKQ